MKVIICPGIHQTRLTDRFLESLLFDNSNSLMLSEKEKYLIFSTESFPAYSPLHIYQWLDKPEIVAEELFFICFSAGVVGGMGAALALRWKQVKIKGFVAVDGWGVPLLGDFPIYRFSHDYFTHWSSALLGTGKEAFYCDPPVPHLTLWERPETCTGWIVRCDENIETKIKSSARKYLQQIIKSQE